MSPHKLSRSTITALIAFVLVFDLAFAVQKMSGAYRSEFGGHPHEASHFISSLFWRDFIVSFARSRVEGKHEAFGVAKAEFEAQWEAHYPHVETGARPSLFTALEAGWMIAFPATRGSLLILMAVLSAILATLLYLALRKEFGAIPAGLAAALLLLLPLTREFTAMAMPDVFNAVLVFGFALAVGEFLDRKRKLMARRLAGRWIAVGALLFAVPLRQAFASSVHEQRMFLPALPAALMFGLAGANWLVNRLTQRTTSIAERPRLRATLIAFLAVLAFSSAAAQWTGAVNTGFAPLAETLIDESSPGDVILISSDAVGEERFIAELAEREARPGHPVLCGTRSLGHPGKKSASDEPVFDSDAAMFTFLTSGKIKFVVLDDSVPDEERREHHYQIKRAIDAHLDRFWSIATCPITRDGVLQGTPVTLYKLREGN